MSYVFSICCLFVINCAFNKNVCTESWFSVIMYEVNIQKHKHSIFIGIINRYLYSKISFKLSHAFSSTVLVLKHTEIVCVCMMYMYVCINV